MSKRKTVASSDEDMQDYEFRLESPELPIKQIATSKRQKSKARPNADQDNDEDDRPVAKKTKTAKPKAQVAKKSASSGSKTTDEHGFTVGVNELGEKFVDLGKKRRATSVVHNVGNTFLDIREFYGDDDDLKPGKKGISLAQEQWEVLKSSSDVIDTFFAKLK
ncbi:Activated RNA polymerase II transcriptional coactivator p15 [Grifola frondosa]|uniref:Activated RNA polymerase II transcriptional coactivator p15 n=1 Tax=Grifola frondosa TaxID=5627 RepID=A0A1C7LS91_GRIFR|nr:Activated RNA polymerase II transcriptional coactivator p15 [Grifola frondosa]